MRYAILTFLWAVALVAYVQRSAISVPLQEIGRDLAVQNTWFGDATRALGFLQSAWHFGYALLQIPAGRLADRIGGRRAIVLLAILWSLATAVTGFARSYWELVAAWTLMGALQAGVFPCAVRSIGQVFGEKERARASGWLGAGMLAGGAIAPVLTAGLLERFAPWAAAENIARWRICLVLYCLPGLAWAAAYWLGTRERKGDRHLLLRKTSQSPGDKNEPAPRAWSDSSLWLLCGQQFLRAAAMIFFVTWFPTFLRETRGVSLLQSGLLTSYAGVAAMFGVICGGYASDWLLARTGSKRIARQFLAASAMASCAVLIVFSSFVADVNAAIALISAGAFIACFGGVAGYTVAIDYGGDRVGTVFGAMNMAGSFGAMLFPVTVGWLVSATGTWNAALFTFAALMAVDAVLWAMLNPKGRFMKPQEGFRDRLLECLGGPWPERCPLEPRPREPVEVDGRRITSGRHEGYRIESIDYCVEPGERVPALLLVPDGVDAAHPAPAIAVWHQHNGEWHLGKSEPAGLAGNPMHHTGAALAKEGYVVLCPDAVCFEERRSPFLKDGNFERFEFLRHVVAGRCLAWKNILDMRRAIDLLVSRPEVDPARIGCYGHSMGSTHTWLVGPWDDRISCLVGNCCLPTYAAIERTHLLHCFPNFIPGIHRFGDTPDIAALIAPRPLLLNFGETDKGSPIEEVRMGLETIAAAYREAGRADAFDSFIEPGVGHVLSPAMWERTRGWFKKHL